MGLACPNCNGMGVKDGEECPVCVGGGTVEREPFEVTPEFKPAVSSATQLPPSTATPDGNVPAAVSGQGAATIPEGVTNPASPESVDVGDELIAQPITDVPDSGGAIVVNEDAKEASLNPEGGAEGGAPAEGEEEGGYETLTNAELQDELRARDLATSGTKDELIARLEEDDANVPA